MICSQRATEDVNISTGSSIGIRSKTSITYHCETIHYLF